MHGTSSFFLRCHSLAANDIRRKRCQHLFSSRCFVGIRFGRGCRDSTRQPNSPFPGAGPEAGIPSALIPATSLRKKWPSRPKRRRYHGRRMRAILHAADNMGRTAAHDERSVYCCAEAYYASAVAKVWMLRVSSLNSTPIRWAGSPDARYLSA